MSKTLARARATGASLPLAPQPPELICRTDNLGALRAAVHQGANQIRLVWHPGPSAGEAAQHHLFQLISLKKALQYARQQGCEVGVEVDARFPLHRDALRQLRDVFAAGIKNLCLSDQALALYLRLHHPEVRIGLLLDDTHLHRRTLALLRAQLGISRVVLPRTFSLAQLEALQGAAALQLEVQVYGAGCGIITGRRAAALEAGEILTHGREDQRCADGRGASNDSCFAATDGTGQAALLLLPELCRSGVSALIVETGTCPASRVAPLIRAWREAIDRERTRSFAAQTCAPIDG